MSWFYAILTTSILLHVRASTTEQLDHNEFIYGQFPVDFMWGVGTSSYQIEGAWNKDGKAENIWDNFTHRRPSPIKDGSTGDIACDSYLRFEQDVKLVQNTGVDFYRFSISWSRILPLGTTDLINQPGLDYYGKLIDSLIHHGIIPVITMHHWDLPMALQNTGGWLNEEIIEHFGKFARLLYENYGDRVKTWVTFNEAWVICVVGYGDGEFAPGIKDMPESPYICIHNILKAHARAYRIYEKEFKNKQQGHIGITIDTPWFQPADPNNMEDFGASQKALQFKFGIFANPIVNGDYPELVKSHVEARSKIEGRTISRLPSFDAYWSDCLRGSYDFLGLNHYSTYIVRPSRKEGEPGWYGDQLTESFQDLNWPYTGSTWLRPVPWGLSKVLNWIKGTYNNPPVIVTENGYSDLPNTFLEDTGRIEYYTGYINNLLKAVLIDGCNVRGYSVWSLMDNFEWTSGYTERFGLHWVNFTDPERQRIPKKSVSHLRKIFLSNGFLERRLPWELKVGQMEQCETTRLKGEWTGEKTLVRKENSSTCGCAGG